MKNTQRLNIVYEDRKIIVIDKPGNLLTVATDAIKDKTLYHMVSEYVKKQLGQKGRVFIVHRLDKDTSGLIVFAKSFEVKEELQKLFEEGKAIRKYYAVTQFAPEPKKGSVTNYLCADKFGNVYVSNKNNKFAKKCVTEYEVIKKTDLGYKIDVNILTGRKNQIRITFSEMGCPIIGDKKFGGMKAKKMYLEAYHLDLSAYQKNYIFDTKTN